MTAGCLPSKRSGVLVTDLRVLLLVTAAQDSQSNDFVDRLGGRDIKSYLHTPACQDLFQEIIREDRFAVGIHGAIIVPYLGRCPPGIGLEYGIRSRYDDAVRAI